MSDALKETMAEELNDINLKKTILGAVSDMALNFMVYDRQEDEDLPVGVIEQAIKDGVVTVAEICSTFQQEIR